MNIGLYIDSLVTVNMKINTRQAMGHDCSVLEEQKLFYISKINKYVKKYIKEPEKLIDLSSFKIYNKETTIPELDFANAISSLIQTVIELFELQSYINMEKFKDDTREGLIDYINNLNRLNTERNLRIDMVNKKFRELVSKG